MYMDRLCPYLVLTGLCCGQTAETKAPSPLTAIKTLCVDRFAGPDEIAVQARELAIAGLFTSKLFRIIENCSNADAILKGSVLERSGSRSRSESEGAFGARAGLPGGVVGGSERLSSSETRTEASVTLRINSRDGEILWAHSQDSSGGKAKSAVPDAVERAVRQLAREVERSKGLQP